MITATSWVPRGFAAAFPTKYVFDDDEYGRIAKLAKLQLEDAEQDLLDAKQEEDAAASSSGPSAPSLPAGKTDSAPKDGEDVE